MTKGRSFAFPTRLELGIVSLKLHEEFTPLEIMRLHNNKCKDMTNTMNKLEILQRIHGNAEGISYL